MTPTQELEIKKIIKRFQKFFFEQCLSIVDARMMGREVTITDQGGVIITTIPEGWVEPEGTVPPSLNLNKVRAEAKEKARKNKP